MGEEKEVLLVVFAAAAAIFNQPRARRALGATASRHEDLRSGLIDHSQKMTAAAMQIAEK